MKCCSAVLAAVVLFLVAPKVHCTISFTGLQFTPPGTFQVTEGEIPPITVDYTTSVSTVGIQECIGTIRFIAGTAVPADLESTSIIDVCIPIGPANGTVTIPYHRTVDDIMLEPDEVFQLLLVSIVPASTHGSATVTILDNDDDPFVNLTQPMVDGLENSVEDIMVACATLSNVIAASGTTFPINVTFTVTDMSAILGSDYVVTMDTFSAAFPVGSVNGNSVCATIDIIDDEKLEGNEMLSIEMTAADSSGNNNNLVVGPITTANFTIVDNDFVTIELTSPSDELFLNETDEGSGPTITATIILPSEGLERDLVVFLSTGSSTAVLSFDYLVPIPIEIVFLAQDISGQVNSSVTGFVSGIQDTIVEGPEVFIVELASVLDDFSSVVTLRPSPSTVTVLDDDVSSVEYELVTDFLSVSENGTTSNFCAILHLNSVSLETDISIPILVTETANVTVEGEDFSLSDSVLTFASGLMDGNMSCIDVILIDDAALEFTHAFTLALSDMSTPEGITPLPSSITTTTYIITDNEADLEVSFTGPLSQLVQESNETSPVICVALDTAVLSVEVSFNVTLGVTNGLATGQDWAASGSLNVPVGPTLAEYCLTLTIADDPQYEGEHGFTLDLTPGSPLPVGAQSQVNITIVDPEDAIFRFEMTSYTVDENDSIDIIITTASTLEAEVSVLLGFIPGTAGNADSDFSTTPIVFVPSGSQASIPVNAHSDVLLEGTEYFTIIILESDLYTVDSVNNETTLFINDTNGIDSFSFIEPVNVTEGDNLTFSGRLILSTGTTGITDVSINLAFISGTAVSDLDYEITGNTTVTFPACETCTPEMLTFTFDGISTISDRILEGDEIFLIEYDPPTLNLAVAVMSYNSTAATIIETRPVFDFNDMSYEFQEGVIGVFPMICLVLEGIDEFSSVVTQPLATVTVLPAGPGADGTDFIGSLSLDFTFASPLASNVSCAMVTVRNDQNFEGPEIFTATISAASPFVEILPDSDVNVTITDQEDCLLSFSSLPIMTFSESMSTIDYALSFSTSTISAIRVNGDFNIALMTEFLPVLPQAPVALNNMTDIGAIPQANIMDLMTSGLINLTIPIIDDEVLEYTESVVITLLDIPECSRTFPSVINLLVEDDDAGDFQVGLTLDPAAVYSEGGGGVMVVVTLNRVDNGDIHLDRPIIVFLALLDGDAVVTEDFTHEPMPNITFGPCVDDPILTETIMINFVDDNDLEFDHDFSVNITSIEPEGVLTTGTLPLSLNILDDEAENVTITFDQASFTCEEDSICTVTGSLEHLTGEIQADFNVSLIVDFNIDLQSDSSDASLPTQIMFFVGGPQTFEFNITINDDDDFESFHSFSISFNDTLISGGSVSTTVIVISDRDDAIIGLNATVAEHKEGTELTFCINLVRKIGGAIRREVVYNPVLNGITAVPEEDYDNSTTPLPGDLSLNEGNSQVCFNVTAMTDDILEATQSYSIDLTSSNANVDPAAANLTINILDINTGTFSFEAEELTVTEGVNATVSPRLVIDSVPEGGVQGIVEIELFVSSSGATLNGDYSTTSMTVSFGSADHSTLLSADINGTFTSAAEILIIDDEILETEEGIGLFLFGDGASALGDELDINIVDDEEATVRFNPIKYNAVEGSGTLMVCVEILTEAESSQQTIDVELETIDGAKTNSSSDFNTGVEFGVEFGANIPLNGTIACTEIAIVDDSVFEGNEQNFTATIDFVGFAGSPADNLMCVSDCEATVTIEDNAADSVTVSLNTTGSPLSAVEGTVLQVCVYISQDAAGGRECPIDVALSFSYGGDKPASMGDLSIMDEVVVIEVGEMEVCTSVELIDDDRVEGTQSFSIFIVDASLFVNFDSNILLDISIEDNDFVSATFEEPSVPITIMEADGAYSSDVCIILDIPAEGVECEFDILLEPMGIDAILDEDFSQFQVAVPVPAGVTDGVILCAMPARLEIIDDDIVESDQSFSLNFAGSTIPGTAIFDNSSLDVVIMDDSDTIKVGLSMREYTVPEGTNGTACLETFGQIQRSFNITFTIESLTNILRGEARSVSELISVEFGTNATYNNTITNPELCRDLHNPSDDLKEGITLLMLRIESPDSGVCLGRDQALVIEEGNGVVVAVVTTTSLNVDESDGAVLVCVSLSQLPFQDIVSVSVITSSGTAQGDEDYISVDVVLEWHQDSDLTQCVSVAIINDECVEDKEEVFTVSLSTEEECVDIGSDNQTTITILDDDRLLVDFRDPFVEVEESAGNVTLCVYICDGVLKRNASITLATEDILTWPLPSPTPADFSADSYELTFTPDNADQDMCVTINIVDDDIYEQTEQFMAVLTTNDSCVEFKQESTLISILDDDCVTLDLQPESEMVAESAGVVEVCVSLSGELETSVNAMVFIVSGDATDDDDFSFETGMGSIVLTFTESEEQCINISIAMDNLLEASEHFSVVMGSRDDRVKLNNRISQIYIIDSGMVRFGFSQSVYPVPEEDASGEGYILEVCVELFSGELDREVVIRVESQDGSAIGGEDYVQLMEVLSGLEFVFKPFPPAPQLPIGRRKREVSLSELCVNVSILADDLVETDEYFNLVLSSVDPGVTLMPANATVVISNNDYANVSLAVDAYNVAESDGNVSVCAVLLGGELVREVAVNITTTDTVGTATAGSDYTSVTDYTLSFAAGSPVNSMLCVDIVILEDSAVEDIERFYVELSTSDPVNILSPDNATVSILDDDVLGVGLVSSSFTVNETDGYLTVGVQIQDGSLELEQSVLISTQAGTATPGLDYEDILSMMLILPSGLGVGDVVYFNVSILNDEAVEELFESFTVHLNDTARVSVIGTRYAVVDIREDETDVLGVGLVSSSFTVNETDGYLRVGVEIQEGSLESEQSVLISTQAGTATPGLDYEELLSMMLILPIGLGVGNVVYFNVSILNDEAVEELFESFTVHLNYTARVSVIGTRYAVVDIEEDEADMVMVTFGQAEVLVNEGDSSSVCVNITGQLERSVAISVSISGGSASTGSDHDFPASTFFSFSSSPDTYCISFNTTQDAIYENDETISVRVDSSDPQVNTGTVSTVSILDNDKVEFQLVVVNETVCESDGSAMVCVQLMTVTEREVMASVQLSDLSTQSGLDYTTSTLTFSFPNPSAADTMQCGSVPIMDDTNVEPCEAFYLNLTSSAERSCIVEDDLPNTVIIYDDEDVDELLLFNDSPQIFGRSLTVDYTISGCAQVLCEVIARVDEVDCSPPTGSLTGQWFQESVTTRRTINRLVLTAVPRCPSQVVPVGFEERRFRIDLPQCGVVFTDQQYEVDPVSGDVTVEWAGTGPTAEVNVSEFTCRLPDGTPTDCTSPFVIPGLAPGNHTFSVTPRQISNFSLPQCASRRGLFGSVLTIQL